jgi:4-hydroxybenzoate polyprenyltransferase
MDTRFVERATPLAVIGMALAAFACCVPLGFAGALQPWFLTVASLLLAVAALQSYRAQRTCQRRRNRFSLAVLGLSATVVLLVLLVPQRVAGWIADYLL